MFRYYYFFFFRGKKRLKFTLFALAAPGPSNGRHFRWYFHEKFRSVPWENGDKQWGRTRNTVLQRSEEEKGGGKKGRQIEIFVYVYGEKVKMEYSRVWRFALTACRRIVLVPGKYLKQRKKKKKNIRLDCWTNFWGVITIKG